MTKNDKLILFSFFLSGFAGLCYQVVWVRSLSVIFGKTNAAIAVVVSVFMLGLGLGSLWWGNREKVSRKGFKTFAFLQFGIAGGAMAMLPVFPFLPGIYRGLAQGSGLSGTWALVFIFLLCAVLMFIPTFLMGGTFPVISELYIRQEKSIGKGIGILYGMNTLGAILGAGLTGYFLVGLLGQRETQLAAMALNVLVGLLFLKMTEKNDEIKDVGNRLACSTISRQARKNAQDACSSKLSGQFLLWAAFLTGFAGLAYEILWTRTLATFNSNSIYSFSSILVIYLAGTVTGSFIYSRFLSSRRQAAGLFVLLQFVLFIVVTVSALFLNEIPTLLVPFRGLMKYAVLRVIFPGFFLSAVIIFIPALIMGIVFPLLCKMYTGTLSGLRSRIGKISFFNTLGSTVGPAAAGFILLPLVGVMKGIVITALINFLLAFTGLFFLEELEKTRSEMIKRRIHAAIMASLAVVVLLFFPRGAARILPPSVFRNPNEVHVLKHYSETAEGTVVVVEDRKTGVRGCYVNNSAVCGVTYDALKVVHYMGHLPMMLNPGAKNGLIIGFGIGVTTSAAARHGLESIDCVEICPGVRDAAPLFEGFNNRVWQDPKINFIAGDGRTHLLLTGKKYDIISCDPVHPTLGSGSLYTKEYFELCKARMRRSAVISQYLPLHKMTLKDLKTLLNTFHSVFPHSMVWLAQTHGVLVGSTDELHLTFDNIRDVIARVDDPFFKDPYLVASTLLLDGKGISSFIGNHSLIHSDNRPVLEYFSPGSIEGKHHGMNISELLRKRQRVSALISGIPDVGILGRYTEAQSFYMEGILYHNEGRSGEALRMFERALAKNPENAETRMFHDYLKRR